MQIGISIPDVVVRNPLSRVNSFALYDGPTVNLPKGYHKDSPCPHCGATGTLSAILWTETADEADPDIVCSSCDELW
jgi:hypothetical protein